MNLNFKSFLNLLYQLFIGFINLIYKEKCIICGCSKDGLPLCKNCSNDVEILSGFAHSKIEGVEIYSACFYEGIVKTLIHKLKFQHSLSSAGVLGEILFKSYIKILENSDPDSDFRKNLKNLAVVAIPTNNKNIQTRGYNNVYEIAKKFSVLSNLKILDNFLIKIKNTKPQFELSKKCRASNVKGCFSVNLKNYNGENILIIDDIFTTGSTLKEAITTLKNAGIKNIFCITVSKAVK